MRSWSKVEPLGLEGPADAAIALLAVVSAGVLVGALAHGVGMLIRLLLLFPLAMGALVGVGAGAVINWRRVRAPLLALLIAGIGGATAWGTDLMIGYARERANLTAELEGMVTGIEQELEAARAPGGVGHAVDYVFQAWGEGGDPDFVQVAALMMNLPIPTESGEIVQPPTPVGPVVGVLGWIRATLAQGTSIGKVGRDGTPVGATGTAVLWGVELLLVMGVAAAMAYSAAGEPACSRCRGWYDDEEEVLVVGAEPTREGALAMVQDGRIEELARGMPPSGEGPFAAVVLRRCPQCADGPSYCEVIKVIPTPKEVKRKVLGRGFLEPSVPVALRAALAGAAEQGAEAS